MVQTKFNLSDIGTGTYNGWSNWTTWNCALWINNDTGFYGIAQECETYGEFLLWILPDEDGIGSATTPDGAIWQEADLTEMTQLIKEIHEAA